MSNWITEPGWWSLGVAVVALFISAASVYMSIRTSKRLQAQQQRFVTKTRQQTAVENALAIVISNTASMNGALGVICASIVGQQFSKEKACDFIEKVSRLYAEVRNTSKGVEHHLDKVSRDEINQKINAIDSVGYSLIDAQNPDRLANILVDCSLEMIEACNFIRDKLTEIVSVMNQ